MTDEQHDVVVVGGGPAGVSCALECFDIKLDVLLLEGGARILHFNRRIAHAFAVHFGHRASAFGQLAQSAPQAITVERDRRQSGGNGAGLANGFAKLLAHFLHRLDELRRVGVELFGQVYAE